MDSEAKKIASLLINCFKEGKKLLICGNGGSAAEAQHFAAEFIGRFEKRDTPLPAIALTTDSSILTCISNDWDFDYVFERQIEALGKKGDVLIGMTTSGKSANILNAFNCARENGLIVIDFPRHGKTTARIQENQLKLLHDVCREVGKKIK